MKQSLHPPDEIYGELFRDVELNKIFEDSKTFVDSIPKKAPEIILAEYRELKHTEKDGINLKGFIEKNFVIPKIPHSEYVSIDTDIVTHITNLWTILRRKSDEGIHGSSLLPLPYEYIVPGGRFREIYYWDSYFTMLGLKDSKLYDLMESMVQNFAFLIDSYGHMPNGNRTYYLSRSQPPVLSLMVDMLAEVKGKDEYLRYMKHIEQEYNYWMDVDGYTKHIVKMPDGSILNRYYDKLGVPRPEMYAEDVATASKVNDEKRTALYRNIRSAAESGWDFSSRWLKDGMNMQTIQTTNIIPVDLNCLLHHMELTLSNIYEMQGDYVQSIHYREKAANRKNSILKYCWSKKHHWFVDYLIKEKKSSGELTIAGMFPFFFKLAEPDKIVHVTKVIEKHFLKAGGVVTTLIRTGQQWDAPNGWAPMQWITIIGLENYGQSALAKTIAERWFQLNNRIFKRTGKMEEKYDVEDADKRGSGGEYPSQDGFGWTNGVLLALINKYNLH
jgi:alpha,alpha-trehalase